MSDENRSVVNQFFQAYGQQRSVDLAGETFSADAVIHTTAAGLAPMNLEAYKQLGSVFLNAFADLAISIDDQIADGDKVVTRLTWSGTHTGELQGMPATGRAFSSAGIIIDRVQDGRIAERHDIGDILGMMKQLGAAG